jgi:hypothetical protein
MRHFAQGPFQRQVRFLRPQFLEDQNLPFTGVLSAEVVWQAVTAIRTCWKERIYSPLVTLCVFRSQVLSQDYSCRAAVARLIAHRVSRGQAPCSSETGAYCLTRKVTRAVQAKHDEYLSALAGGIHTPFERLVTTRAGALYRRRRPKSRPAG